MNKDISGKDIADKIQGLNLDGKLKLTPELFNEPCKHQSVQPFLKWFCETVNTDNILLRDEIQMRRNLQESGTWLTGKELDDELEKAVADHPELLALTSSNRTFQSDIPKAYESEKISYDEDLKDLEELKKNLKQLKEIEIKLDEEIDEEELSIEKLRIEENKINNDCVELIEEYDSAMRDIYQTLQNLLKIYSEAFDKKEPTVLWTQVNLDVYLKQLETYINCLQLYMRREHKNLLKGLTEIHLTNDNEKADESSPEEVDHDNSYKLLKFKQNIFTSKLNEIYSKVDRFTTETLAERVAEIYNNGDLKIPLTEIQANLEKIEYTSKRDILEKNITIIYERLKESIKRYGEFLVTQILVENGGARLRKKRKRLDELEYLLYSVCDMGHSQSDLLSILMQLQLRKLQGIIDSVTTTQHYLFMEYTLTSKRCAVMQELKTQYNSIISSSPCNHNAYNKIFSTLIQKDDTSGCTEFNSSIKQYDDLIVESKRMRQEILNDHLDQKINDLQQIENEIISKYEMEINNGQTKNFSVMSNNLITKFENVVKNVKEVEDNVNDIRKKLKNFLTTVSKNSLERDKVILWQKFLADPEGLKNKYDEVMSIIDRSHFVKSLQKE